jgi:hypothetical protein
MAYDKELDKQLFNETVEFETSKISVAVYAYNEGTPKLQLSREVLNPDDGAWKWSKLGRMLKEEAEKVIPLMQKALEHM